jgi:hypothetical protein
MGISTIILLFSAAAQDWMNEKCGIVSIAAFFRDLNKKMLQ